MKNAFAHTHLYACCVGGDWGGVSVAPRRKKLSKARASVQQTMAPVMPSAA